MGRGKSHYTKLHLAILQHYVTYLETMSEQELPNIVISGSDSQELKKYVFRVPTLKKLLPEGQHCNKYRAVKEFISFLVRFLYHKPRSITDSCVEQMTSLEKELRFLLTVLGDTPFMEEFENPLAEFEGVANEAGCLVHSIFFPQSDDGIGIGIGIAVVINHINLLKANIVNLTTSLVAQDYSTYIMPNKTPVLESVLDLDLLVRDLEDLINRGISADVKDQIQTLHQGLLCFQPFIKDTESYTTRSSSQDELEEYYTRIGDLAHEAQHLIVSFSAGDAPSWYLINRLIHINNKIQLCRIELPQISTMKCKSEVAKYFTKQMPLPKRNSTDVDEDIIGSEVNMRYMLDHLVGGGVELRVISIFGMPGLGKTTLANKLYKHPLVTERFDRLSWCAISQSYSRRNVLTNILIHIASDHLGKDVILKMEEDKLAESIHKTLKGRRYLIVMDDIWDSHVCDELVRCFPDDGNKSRVLFTTRNKDVIPPNCIMYALPSLSDLQCWELIQRKVFNNQPCPQELLKSGWEMAESCSGMPLAAVVIAGVLLTTNKEERAWEEVRRNLSSYILDGGHNSVMQILKLSYDHLPQHLKLCFLYLGVFFAHQKIPTHYMMNLWIAEGFIHNKNEENAAEEYLKELIDKSLVMVADRRSDGRPKTCLIHDLLRELCLKTCEEEKLTRFINNSRYSEKEESRLGMNSTTWMCCRYICNHLGQHSRSSYQIEVPDMRLLRVLYFDCSFLYLTGIEYLVCLKYLVVADLPPCISNLVNLEYLHVLSNKYVYLHSAIMKMKKLKYVDAGPWAMYGRDCSTSQTNKLEFLSRVFIRKPKDKKTLKCSPHLRILKCVYWVWPMYKDLSFLTRLESLTLVVQMYMIGGLILSLPSSIKKLSLSGYGSKLPRKTMSMIGRLENLQILKLRSMRFEGERWDTRDGEFQKLRYLGLHLMSFRRWNVESSQHFPKLQQLDLSLCFKLGGIPAEIGEIPTMRIIRVDMWQNGSARRIQEEQRDMGNEDLRIASFPPTL